MWPSARKSPVIAVADDGPDRGHRQRRNNPPSAFGQRRAFAGNGRDGDAGSGERPARPGSTSPAASASSAQRHAQDTEHPGANGYEAFHSLRLGRVLEDAHFQVAGKTGTAQVNSPGLDYRDVTWFDFYGPFSDPRYAVVVMVVGGGSGGKTWHRWRRDLQSDCGDGKQRHLRRAMREIETVRGESHERKSDLTGPAGGDGGAGRGRGVFPFQASGAGAQEPSPAEVFPANRLCLAGAAAGAAFCLVDYSKVARWSR